MVYRQQKFISHGAGAREVQIKVLADLVCGDGTFSGSQMVFASCDLTWWKGQGSFLENI
jgi:hypothetical protein